MPMESEVVELSEELGAPIESVPEFGAVAKFSSFAPWASKTAMTSRFHTDEDG